ncbi:UNVERIFIED_CONTAM: hypothetical protein FKN15_005439 [Acipenser sinensis]
MSDQEMIYQEGEGTGGSKVFGRSVAVGVPGPRTGAEWGHPWAATVLDRHLACPPYCRAPLMGPVFQPPAEASWRETSSLMCGTSWEVSHIDRDCPAMGCDVIRPVNTRTLPHVVSEVGFTGTAHTKQCKTREQNGSPAVHHLHGSPAGNPYCGDAGEVGYTGFTPSSGPREGEGTGGRGSKVFGWSVAVGDPGPRTGAEWGHPWAATVLDRHLACPPYCRAPLMGPVFQPPAEASWRETSSLMCGTSWEVSHIDRDCPAMGCDVIRPVHTAELERLIQAWKLPLPEPIEVELPLPEPREVELPLPESREVELPLPEPREVELPLPEPREVELPLPEPKEEELPLPEPREVELPLPEPREEELPLPEPKEEELPLPEPREVEMPLPEPRGEEPPLVLLAN